MFKYILHFIIVAYLFGQENSDLKLIGHLGESNGDCNVVEVIGDTAYFVEGKGFKIVDYSDKENPVLISQCFIPDNKSRSITIENNYAYLLSASYLMIIDISDRSQPLFIKQLKIDGGNNIAAKDNLLYIAYGYCIEYYCNGGCLMLDVSNINSIYERYNYVTYHPVFDVAIKDTTAYLSVQDSLIILNISNPDLPKKVTQFANGAYSSSLCIADNILYAVYPFTEMSVFNIDNPYQLNLIGTLDVSGIKAELHNNYLFIAQYFDAGPDDLKITVVDVASPGTPVKISEINMGDYGLSKSLDYSNNYLYVSHGSSGLYVIDVSDVSHPVEITRYLTGYKNDVAVNNDYAYLVSDYEGIQIIDIKNKTNPHLIKSIDLKEYPSDRTKKIFIEDNILYIMIDKSGGDFVNPIYMFDISDPTDPKLLGSFTTNLMTDFEVKNKVIYFTGITEFRIVDAADPKNPLFLTTFSKGSGSGRDIKISGNYAFLGEWVSGLKIIDITDPGNVFETANYNDFCVGDIYIHGKLVYIIAQSHREPECSFRILDISDITSIKELGSVKLSSSYTYCINYKNEKIILGDGLKVIDVSDPENPVVIDSSDICENLNKIILEDKYIYAADGINGFYIFQYDGLVTSIENNDLNNYSFRLYQNYPNPFNPLTTISYTLPENGLVQLSIFDMLGRQVASLINKEQSKGYHKIELDASYLANGIYFYRLQTKSHSETKKLILIK